jgi:predicted neuraminidase
VACATFKYLPGSDDLLMVWNDYDRRTPQMTGWRTPLTVAISRDDGQSWENHKDLEDSPNGNYSYPSIAFVGNEVCITYTAGDEWASGSRMARFAVDWLYR